MDLKVVFAVVLLSALAITSTHAGIPRCCIKITKFPPKLLLKAVRWERQYSYGACDLDALIVYIKKLRKPLCVDPKMEDFLTMRKKRQKY
uniref:Chemokine interleukin-8-like domain-containing protein n=1 Tax=Cyprinodon variegatus TaxID=28743 RepID=A0A3Q2EI14_CYPVA